MGLFFCTPKTFDSRYKGLLPLKGVYVPDPKESHQFAQQQIQSCDRKLESYLKVLPTRQVEITLPAQGVSPVRAAKARKASRGNTPDIPGMDEELVRIYCMDLTGWGWRPAATSRR